jgi:thioesterase domain-containing protein/aryl carrier-like protein
VSDQAPTAPNTSAAAKRSEQDFWAALRATVTTQQQAPSILPADRETALLLSCAQERLWLLAQFQREHGIYHLPYGFRLLGTLNRQALIQSLQEIVKRHEILRTAFSEVDNQPIAHIQPEARIVLAEFDVQAMALPQRDSEALQHLQTILAQPFSLDAAPLFRGILVQLREQEHLLGFCFHHIIFDGWSEGLFFKELQLFYDAFSCHQPASLDPLPIQYGDYAVWQRHWLRGEGVAPQRQYWAQQLRHCSVLQLPYDAPLSARVSCAGSRQTLPLDASLTRSLRELSQTLGVTLFTLLLAAFQALLYRYSGQQDLLLCSPVAGRTRPEVQSLIGYFNNILPLRCQVAGDLSFSQWVQQVHTITLAAQQHQDLPLQQMSELADVNSMALSRVLFAFLNVPQHPLRLTGLAVEPLESSAQVADFDLFCCWQEHQTQLTARVDFKTALFQEQTIADLLGNYQRILLGVVAHPEQSIAEIPVSVPIREKSVWDAPPPLKQTAQDPLESLTETEQTLVQLFRQASGLAAIGRSENLLDLGLSSLQALKAFSAIEQTFSRRLPLSTLIQAPTVTAIAQVLDQTDAAAPWSPLVALQPEGTASPFFCVPGLAGNVLYLRKLAEYLGSNQPFYGLQARGSDGKEASFKNVEAMAAYYIQAIQTIQPEGPYYLGGHSFGGLVAFEMAQQLTAQGQDIALLALIDRQGPNLKQNPNISVWERISLKLANWNALDREDQWKYLQKEILDRVDYWGERLLTKNRYRAWMRKSPIDPVSAAHWQALTHYTPKFYPGRLCLFTAQVKRTYEAYDPLLGWEGMAAAVGIFQVSGNHVGMFKEPYVRELAKQLKAAIQPG